MVTHKNTTQIYIIYQYWIENRILIESIRMILKGMKKEHFHFSFSSSWRKINKVLDIKYGMFHVLFKSANSF